MRNLPTITLIFTFGLALNSLYYEDIPLFLLSSVLFLVNLAWLYRHPISHPVGTWKYYRKDWQGTVEQFNIAIQQNPRDAYAHFMRGNAYTNLEAYDLALKDLAYALELQPKWINAYVNMSYIAYERDDYLQSMKYAEEALKVNPKLLQALSNRAVAYVMLNQVDAARADYDTIMRFYPLSGYAQVGLSSIYIREGNFDEAIHLCSDVINVKGMRIYALNSRAYAHALKGNFDLSLRDANQGISENPTFFYLYSTRGQTYFLMGRYREALADFEKHEALKPNSAFAIAGQAVTYHAQGELQMAHVTWHRLISLKPQYRDAKQLVSDYFPAPQMVEEARKIVARLKLDQEAPVEPVA